MVDDLKITEGSQICTASICGSCADKSNGPRNYAGDQKFVIEDSGSTLLVRIDLNMRDLEAF